MKSVIKWFAGFFEDQKGSASSKRATLYVCLFFLGMIVRGSLDGKTVDFNLLITLAAIIGFCIGMITSEFAGSIFTKLTDKKEDSKPHGQ